VHAITRSELPVDSVPEIEPPLNLLIQTDMNRMIDHHPEGFEKLLGSRSGSVREADGLHRPLHQTKNSASLLISTHVTLHDSRGFLAVAASEELTEPTFSWLTS
jgi:hypothetical protein